MPTIRLVRSPQRADLRSFAVATAVLWVMLAATASVATRRIWPIGVAGLTAVTIVALGVWRPQRLLWPYRMFNGLASPVSRLTAAAVRWVCFYVIIGGAGLAGSRLQQVRTAGLTSGWRRRGRLEITTMWQSTTVRRPNGWVRDYAKWAITRTNRWAWCLLPFLMILSTVEAEEEDELSGGNYTLY
jgi:hypothetical protein